MICSIQTLGLTGIRGNSIVAECYISNGLPGFDIVGLPDAAVKEARERVRAAIKNCGAKFPVSRITVNLAPAGQKKAGTVYDLPIFVGILAAGGELPKLPEDAAFLGELSLTGALRGVPGVLPMAMAAKEAGIRQLFDEELVVAGDRRRLFVTLGQFSIVRLEREAQLIVPVLDYAIPDKECCDTPGACAEDPCEMFSRIPFPTQQFAPRGCDSPENDGCNS